MKGVNMIQEINIGGDRQTGKSYAAMKLAIDAAIQGERVIYDCDTVRMMACRFQDLRKLTPDDAIEKVWLANGNERIRFHDGGEIVMMCRSRGGGRGYTADVHVIDHEMESRVGAEINPTVKRVIRTVLTPGDLAVVGTEC